jgi:hypothetical protein
MHNERTLDYEHPLQIARSLREQVDWDEVRARTAHTPSAAPFFTLVERLGIVSHVAEPQTTKPRIRVA